MTNGARPSTPATKTYRWEAGTGGIGIRGIRRPLEQDFEGTASDPGNRRTALGCVAGGAATGRGAGPLYGDGGAAGQPRRDFEPHRARRPGPQGGGQAGPAAGRCEFSASGRGARDGPGDGGV